MKTPDFLCRIPQTRLGKIAVQFVKFGIVGVLNTGISLAVYYIFLGIDNRLYLIGNIAGFLLSALNAYWLNHTYVFNARNSKTRGKYILLKTYLAYALSLAISTALLYVFVNYLRISESIAPLCCLLITVPMNYLINKFWVYQQQEG